MKIFSYKTNIKKDNLDLYGHVNNAEYLRLYEEARWKLIYIENLNEKLVIEEQLGPVILNLSISFKKELLLNDKIEIRLVDAFRKNRLLFIVKQEIIKDDNIVSEIELLLGIMDLRKRKLVEPDSRWLKALGLDH